MDQFEGGGGGGNGFCTGAAAGDEQDGVVFLWRGDGEGGEVGVVGLDADVAGHAGGVLDGVVGS